MYMFVLITYEKMNTFAAHMRYVFAETSMCLFKGHTFLMPESFCTLIVSCTHTFEVVCIYTV